MKNALSANATGQSKSSSAAETSPVTVLLTHDQTATIDEIIAGIRRNTGKTISRSALIRAVVSGVLPPFETWLWCRSEAELEQLIKAHCRELDRKASGASLPHTR